MQYLCIPVLGAWSMCNLYVEHIANASKDRGHSLSRLLDVYILYDKKLTVLVKLHIIQFNLWC